MFKQLEFTEHTHSLFGTYIINLFIPEGEFIDAYSYLQYVVHNI